MSELLNDFLKGINEMPKILKDSKHYSTHLLHQILKLEGTKYIKDYGTADGRVYLIEYEGVKHMFYGLPLFDDDVTITVNRRKKLNG